MSTLNYKIENNHFIVTLGEKTNYYYIGSMKGINAEVVNHKKGRLDLTILFPEIGGVTFSIPYQTKEQNIIAQREAEKIVMALIEHSKQKKSRL